MSGGKITLITGGGRSGKSSHALDLARTYKGGKVFIATAEAFDDEMRSRIGRHRRERGDDFLTVEEPVDPARALAELSARPAVIVVDCLTVWLGNLMHRGGPDGRFPEVARLMDALLEPPCDMILVSNEVGMGIIPDNEMSRRFRDLAGRVNQDIAALSHCVILMVCGIPLFVKGETY